MNNRFNFVEKYDVSKNDIVVFEAQKVMQTDGSMAYAISWKENDLLKIELYSLKEVEMKLRLKLWVIY